MDDARREQQAIYSLHPAARKVLDTLANGSSRRRDPLTNGLAADSFATYI